MNRASNILIQLGEALGPEGALVVLLLICAGSVWVVMSIRRNQDDHARIEKKVDAGFERLEKKIDFGFERLEGEVESSRKETRDESKETRAQIQAFRDETRAESKEARVETRAELRSINARLDRIIDGTPPDQPG